jgi:hypothetical protein
MIECLSDKNSTIRVIVGFPFLIGYPLFIVDGLSLSFQHCRYDSPMQWQSWLTVLIPEWEPMAVLEGREDEVIGWADLRYKTLYTIDC